MEESILGYNQAPDGRFETGRDQTIRLELRMRRAQPRILRVSRTGQNSAARSKMANGDIVRIPGSSKPTEY